MQAITQVNENDFRSPAVKGIAAAKLDLSHGPPLLDFQHTLVPEGDAKRARAVLVLGKFAQEKLYTLRAFGELNQFVHEQMSVCTIHWILGAFEGGR